MAGPAMGYRNNSSTSSRLIQGTLLSVLTTSLYLLIHFNSYYFLINLVNKYYRQYSTGVSAVFTVY